MLNTQHLGKSLVPWVKILTPSPRWEKEWSGSPKTSPCRFTTMEMQTRNRSGDACARAKKPRKPPDSRFGFMKASCSLMSALNTGKWTSVTQLILPQKQASGSMEFQSLTEKKLFRNRWNMGSHQTVMTLQKSVFIGKSGLLSSGLQFLWEFFHDPSPVPEIEVVNYAIDAFLMVYPSLFYPWWQSFLAHPRESIIINHHFQYCTCHSISGCISLFQTDVLYLGCSMIDRVGLLKRILGDGWCHQSMNGDLSWFIYIVYTYQSLDSWRPNYHVLAIRRTKNDTNQNTSNNIYKSNTNNTSRITDITQH